MSRRPTTDSPPSGISRRTLLADAAVGLAAIPFLGRLSVARAEGVHPTVLSASEAEALEALGDALLPGAGDAGIALYVDAQLASPTPLLMLSYLDFPMPATEFYRSGLAALDGLSRSSYQKGFARLPAPAQVQIISAISAGNPDGWDGPPAPLFYFVTRNDALDVVYGSKAAFRRLGIPYRAHIEPPSQW